MKYIIPIVLLFCTGFLVNPKSINPVNIKRDTVPNVVPQLFGGKLYEFGNYVVIDSFLMVKGGDTFAIPRWPGIKYKTSDHRWYGSTPYHWQSFLFGADTTTFLATKSDITNNTVDANNGLTKTGNTIQLGAQTTLGAPLMWDSYIYSDIYSLNMLGATASSGVLNVTNVSGGFGISGISNSVNGAGVAATNTSGGIAFTAETTTGKSAYISTTEGLPIYTVAQPTNTNGNVIMAELHRQTSGTAANGISQSIDYWLQLNNNTVDTFSRTKIIGTNTTPGSQTGSYELWLKNNGGVLARKTRVAGTGQWTWDGYPALTAQTDTTTYKPIAIDGSGNVVKFGGWPGGGGAGSVTQVNTGYGLSGGPITTTGTLVADTTTLKSVFLPLYVNSNKTINQATSNIVYTGGGQVKFDSTRHSQTYISPTLLADSLVTFGNSITAGSNATVQDSAYPNITAAFYGLPLINKGISGTVAYQACASNLAFINPGHSAMVTYCIGLNDYRVNGGGATMYRGVKNSYEAAMINQFLASYVSASNGAVTRYGSWTTNYDAVTNSGGKTTSAAYSSNQNDSLTTDVTGTSVAIGIIGSFLNLRDAIIYIDGIRVDSFSTSGQTANVGTTYQSMGKYYTGLSNGTHHVKVKVGPGSNFLLVDYIGTFVPTAAMKPFVMLHVPHMDATGYGTGNATQAIIDAGNDSLTAAYNRAFAAGLNVYLAHTNDYYNATTSSGLSSDHIHPNDLGMHQFFSAIRFGLSSAISLDGTLRYSNDGHFYGTQVNGELSQIPYTQDLTLQRVLTNGSYLNVPNYISGSNSLDFQIFPRISLREFKVLSNGTAYQHGVLGAQGPNATLFIGERNTDTTKGFILYTSGNLFRVFDMYNNTDIIKIDTSFRVLFRNNSHNNVLANPTATIHIGGNDGGIPGQTSLKIDSGLLVTIPEKYAIENDGLHLYYTNRSLNRVRLDSGGIASINSQTGGSQTIVGGTGIDVNSSSNTHTVSLSSDYITSSTYTPTITNVSNVSASTAYPCQYIRVGNTVTVSGKIDIDPVGASPCILAIDLPIASALTNDYQAGGTASAGLESFVGSIRADATNDRVQLDFVIPAAGSVGNNSWFFSFTYRIL